MAGDGGFSSSETAAINLAMFLTSAVSFCASLVACACYVALRHKRTFGLQLVFFQSLNDAGGQLWVLIQVFRGEVRARGPRPAPRRLTPAQGAALCTLQSYLAGYFPLSCILWSSAIAYTLFAAVVRGQQLDRVAKLLPRMVLLCQGAPVVSCAVVQLFDAFGSAGTWCWIKSDKERNRVLQFATLYFPLWLCIAFTLCVYIVVRLRLRALFRESAHWARAAPMPPPPPSLSSVHPSSSSWISQTDFEPEDGSYVELVETGKPPPAALPRSAGVVSQRDQQRKLFRRLMAYPVILVACWAWPTLDRAYGFLNEGQHLFWMTFMHSVATPLQGLLNSIAYGLTEGVGREVLARLRGRCARCQGTVPGNGAGERNGQALTPPPTMVPILPPTTLGNGAGKR